MTTMWDVRFDGKPRIVMHICQAHEETARRYFPCGDEDANGQCPHVQTTRCTCAAPPSCEACMVDAAMAAEQVG